MSKPDRINHLIRASRIQRDQLDAMAKEFVELHGALPGSDDEDDLIAVIRDGEDYKYAMLAMRQRRARRKGK